MPALRAVRAAFPEHRITLVAGPTLAPLVFETGAVDAVGEPVADSDVAVNLHGRGPQSHQRLLRLRPSRLIAFASGDVPGPMWRPGEHEVHRWCRMLQESGVPADPTRLDLPRSGVRREPGLTLVHPGAASGARRWPAERFAAVAAAERQKGREVVITGNARELELGREVAARAGLPAASVRAGRTDLLQLLDLVASAGRLVCGDTGVAHVATAVGTPSVLLFGPTSPREWGPPTDRPWHRTLWAGGSGDPHADACDPGLLAIAVEDVLEALEGIDEEVPGAVAPRR